MLWGMSLTVDILEGMDRVEAAEWDALTGEHDPFVEHAFLHTLEAAGCVGAEAGWIPCHVVVRDQGALVGAMPLYLKDNSFGEYIFDWAWAEAAEAGGLRYYPKLVSAVPFTPVAGRRLLVRPGANESEVRDAMLAGAMNLADAVGARSLHILFCSQAELPACQLAGLMPRLSYQFHWTNHGWSDFDAYLAALRSQPRKKIRRERRRAAAAGLELATRSGEALEAQTWEALHGFYIETASRKWGRPYLNAEFFRLAHRTLSHRAVVTLACRGDALVAGALSFCKGQQLYGRYWGCTEDAHSLHFELCYHRPIELCLDRGWRRFEAGAQGLHKLKRGLLPAATHSAHWIRHHELSRSVEQFLERERRAVTYEMEQLLSHGPFRRDRALAVG